MDFHHKFKKCKLKLQKLLNIKHAFFPQLPRFTWITNQKNIFQFEIDVTGKYTFSIHVLYTIRCVDLRLYFQTRALTHR